MPQESSKFLNGSDISACGCECYASELWFLHSLFSLPPLDTLFPTFKDVPVLALIPTTSHRFFTFPWRKASIAFHWYNGSKIANLRILMIFLIVELYLFCFILIDMTTIDNRSGLFFIYLLYNSAPGTWYLVLREKMLTMWRKRLSSKSCLLTLCKYFRLIRIIISVDWIVPKPIDSHLFGSQRPW